MQNTATYNQGYLGLLHWAQTFAQHLFNLQCPKARCRAGFTSHQAKHRTTAYLGHYNICKLYFLNQSSSKTSPPFLNLKHSINLTLKEFIPSFPEFCLRTRDKEPRDITS